MAQRVLVSFFVPYPYPRAANAVPGRRPLAVPQPTAHRRSSAAVPNQPQHALRVQRHQTRIRLAGGQIHPHSVPARDAAPPRPTPSAGSTSCLQRQLPAAPNSPPRHPARKMLQPTRARGTTRPRMIPASRRSDHRPSPSTPPPGVGPFAPLQPTIPCSARKRPPQIAPAAPKPSSQNRWRRANAYVVIHTRRPPGRQTRHASLPARNVGLPRDKTGPRRRHDPASD